jgi:hypothetical protein
VFYTILRNPNGNRNILYLYRNDDGKWNWNYNWLDNDWNSDNPSALANLFVSPSKNSFNQSAQSCSGILKHCERYKIEKKIFRIISDCL